MRRSHLSPTLKDLPLLIGGALGLAAIWMLVWLGLPALVIWLFGIR